MYPSPLLPIQSSSKSDIARTVRSSRWHIVAALHSAYLTQWLSALQLVRGPAEPIPAVRLRASQQRSIRGDGVSVRPSTPTGSAVCISSKSRHQRALRLDHAVRRPLFCFFSLFPFFPLRHSDCILPCTCRPFI